jgi:hypothetical protein
MIVPVGYTAARLALNPLISPQMFAEANVLADGDNINGPSLIRVPDWLPPEKRADPQALYYLYFAHHNGQYIRMAWAKKIDGPYRLFNPGAGVLSLCRPEATLTRDGSLPVIATNENSGFGGHIASPDVHIDSANQRFIMYFHANAMRRDAGEWIRRKVQLTFVTSSATGLDFNRNIRSEIIGPFYLRVFEHAGKTYGSACNLLYGMKDRFSLVIPPGKQFPELAPARHTTVRKQGDTLTIFFTRVGDAPERILYLPVQLADDPQLWKAPFEPIDLLRPEFAFEGADLPVQPSQPGAVHGAECALRDPYHFRDVDGSEYLLYSVKGEKGIAIARLAVLEALNV